MRRLRTVRPMPPHRGKAGIYLDQPKYLRTEKESWQRRPAGHTRARAAKAMNRPEPVSDAHFRLLVESVSDYAIITLDATGLRDHLEQRGRSASRDTGRKRLSGGIFPAFILRIRLRLGFPERELRIAATEGRFEDENWRVRKDGSRFWANVVITALRDQDRQSPRFRENDARPESASTGRRSAFASSSSLLRTPW